MFEIGANDSSFFVCPWHGLALLKPFGTRFAGFKRKSLAPAGLIIMSIISAAILDQLFPPTLLFKVKALCPS